MRSRRNIVLTAIVIIVGCLSFFVWSSSQHSSVVQSRFTISTETTYITEPQTKDGLVDYRTYLTQQYSAGVTPETNAAVDYWRAIGNSAEICDDPAYFERLKDQLGPDPFDAGGPYLIDLQRFIEKKSAEGMVSVEEKINQEFEAGMAGPWNPEDQPLMQEWLTLNQRPLDHILVGTSKLHCYRPLINLPEDADLMGYYMPDTHLSRAMGQLLKLHAFRALQANEAELAVRDLLAMHRLSRHVAQGPASIEMTIGGAIEVMATHADQQLVNSGRASVEQLRGYAADLAALPPLTDFERIINGERMMCLDALQRLPTNSEPEGIPAQEINAALLVANDIYDDLESAVRKSGYEPTRRSFRRNIESLEEQIVAMNSRTDSLWSFFSGTRNSSKATTFTVIYAFLPSPEASFERGGFWGQTSTHLSTLGLAISAYQKQYSEFPETLDALIPDYLPQLPEDPYTGNSFVYRIDNEGALVYSLGKNLKDDGGKTLDEDYENHDHVFRVTGP